jgi:6-phosphogluconolactonase (cycloisomerase 2 family)
MTVDPPGRYLYVVNDLNSNAANDTVLALAIDQSSGVVSPLGSPQETAGPGETIICDRAGRFVYLGTDFTASSLASFTISTAPSTAGQLVPSGQTGPSGETMALAIVD